MVLSFAGPRSVRADTAPAGNLVSPGSPQRRSTPHHLGSPARFRRRGLLAAGGAIGLGALVGCAPAQSTAESSPSVAGAGSAGAVRVATLDPFSTYNLLDLGLSPVVVQSDLETVINPRYAEAYQQIPKAGAYDAPDLEAIAATEPELILASTGQAEIEPELAKIARTVLITGTTSSTWRQAAGEVAAAVDRTAQLSELEQAYEARAAKVRSDHSAIIAQYRWAMAWQGKPDGFSVRSFESNGGQVLALAGIQPNTVTERSDGDADTQLSWEQVGELNDADVICLPGSTSGVANAGTEIIQGQRVFQGLPAAAAGRVFVFDYMTPGSYLNATQLLEELDAALAELA